MGNPVQYLNDKIKGEPEYTIKYLLVAAAIIIAVVALFAPPIVKAAVLLWIVMP